MWKMWEWGKRLSSDRDRDRESETKAEMVPLNGWKLVGRWAQGGLECSPPIALGNLTTVVHVGYCRNSNTWGPAMADVPPATGPITAWTMAEFLCHLSNCIDLRPGTRKKEDPTTTESHSQWEHLECEHQPTSEEPLHPSGPFLPPLQDGWREGQIRSICVCVCSLPFTIFITDSFESIFKFTAKLNRKYRQFPRTPDTPPRTASPLSTPLIFLFQVSPRKRSTGILEQPIPKWIEKTGFKHHDDWSAQIFLQERTHLMLRVLLANCSGIALETECWLAQPRSYPFSEWPAPNDWLMAWPSQPNSGQLWRAILARQLSVGSAEAVSGLASHISDSLCPILLPLTPFHWT